MILWFTRDSVCISQCALGNNIIISDPKFHNIHSFQNVLCHLKGIKHHKGLEKLTFCFSRCKGIEREKSLFEVGHGRTTQVSETCVEREPWSPQPDLTSLTVYVLLPWLKSPWVIWLPSSSSNLSHGPWLSSLARSCMPKSGGPGPADRWLVLGDLIGRGLELFSFLVCPLL